jgi:hypothetical protein
MNENESTRDYSFRMMKELESKGWDNFTEEDEGLYEWYAEQTQIEYPVENNFYERP